MISRTCLSNKHSQSKHSIRPSQRKSFTVMTCIIEESHSDLYIIMYRELPGKLEYSFYVLLLLSLGKPSKKKNSVIMENCQKRGGRGPMKPKLEKIFRFGTFYRGRGGSDKSSKLFFAQSIIHDLPI